MTKRRSDVRCLGGSSGKEKVNFRFYGTGRGVKVYHVAQLHCSQTIIFLSAPSPSDRVVTFHLHSSLLKFLLLSHRLGAYQSPPAAEKLCTGAVKIPTVRK